MKNLYFKSKSNLGFLVLLTVMLLGGSFASAQVRVNFTQRTSQYTPTKKIYNVKGDFTMIGNTNMTLEDYSLSEPNSNNQMIYVDVDGDSNTFNSSSATLQLSTENGANPSCSNIVFAGLYWTGRAHNGNSSPNTFNVTKGGVTKSFDKHVVSFKGPGAGSYSSITASNSNIYYPTNSDGYMYSAYAEVTDYVKQHGIGAYTVADIALREGDGGDTGYYGGWSLIVVYENSKMKYRDVTIFDGHAYVAGSVTADFEIPVSGFNTVQAGPVNMKLGLMAGEGDRTINNDYFQIRNAANSAWVTLSHGGNSNNNFFNSSIFTGGNTRTPDLVNNTGLDISMFNINNTSNSVIGNSQTSTTFRYGSNQDTYVIFAVAMSVDAYIPDVEATLSAVTVNGQPAQTPLQSIQPGQEMEYKILIKNKGTEAINNYKIVVPIPYNATYVAGSAQRTVFYNLPSPPSPNALTFEPSVGSNGSIVWNYGTLPLPTDPETVIGQLTFKLKATTDCTILKNLSCSNVVAVDGIMSGAGAITGINFSEKNLIQGFTEAGACQGNAVSAPVLINIDATDYVNQNCQATPPISSFVFCSPGANIPITSISGSFPPGTLFYNQFPVTGSTTQYTINNPFPATVGTSTYYAVPPNSIANCFFPFTITVTTISSQPTASDVSYCVGATASPLTATPSNPNFILYYFATVNGTPQLSITPSTAVAGSTTYYVAEGQSAQCIGPKKPIVVTVYPQPVLNAPSAATIQGCSTSAITTLAYSTTPVTITLGQFQAAGGSIPNSGSIGTYTLSYTDSAVVGSCPKVVTRTFSLASACGTLTATQTITIQDTTAPVIAALPPTSAISCPATPQFAQATATDNCGGTVTLTFVDVNTAKQCLGSYSITRTWTATDACGNTSTASQTINVNDTTPPVIAALPAPSTVVCPATPVFAQATATDACGSEFTLSSNDVTTPGACANSYTITRTWTATDGCGNSSTASQVINVVDNVPPVISALPAPQTVNCTAGALPWVTPTANDACGGNVTLISNDVTTPGQCAGSYTVVRTWTATDICGNAATATQTITVQDTTAPVIAALPATSTISCPATPQFAQATATDACGSAFTLTFNDVTTNGACAGSYSVTRTWTATDACGNSSTASQTINVQDTVAPVIAALPATSTIACPATPQFAQATATDACGSAFTLTFNDVTTNGACAGSYSVTRTWTATDACGNASTASQTINVQDTVAPVIAALPAASTIACPATPQFAQATATDECGSAFTLTFNDVTTNGACAGSYSVTRTWTATDGCGNSSTASQTINVQDTTAPVIAALPATSTIACPATPQFAQATATDECGSIFTLTFNDVTTNGACAGSYSVTRTWTATDACGNASTASQTINVQDTTAPVIAALPATSTIACPATPQFAQATATDACGSAFTLTFNDVTTQGQCAGSYSVTRTWTATDACGNSSTATQTINVQDTAAPVIAALPATSTIACPATPQFAQATATDECGSAFTLTFNDVTTNGACAGSYSVTRTWTATDACGNSSTASQTINVQDTTAPVIAALPATSTIACPATPQFAQATATDECGSAFTLTFNDVTTNGACAGSYSVTRTWTATDACGNSSTASQTINVEDTAAPVIAALPAATTISCPSVPQFEQATATDACGSAFTLTFNDVTTNGQCAGSYSVTRTWTATDACGNTATASQTINVEDTVAPVIAALPATSTIECPAAPQFAQATATDACGSAFTLTFNDVTTQGQCAGSYSVTRTWTATDACGNASTATQTINVQDTTAPNITVQAANISIECDGSGNTTALNDWLADNGGAQATDACSDVVWSNNFNGLANDCSAAVTVIFTATDACGNASNTSATFTVQDTTAPVAPQAPANATAVCAADVPANVTLTATDNCSGTITANGVDSIAAGSCPNAFVITRTWTFTDACNNSSSVSQTITVNDNVAPVAPEAPANVTVACAGEVPAMVSLSATDNCGEVITVEGVDAIAAGQCANNYVITRTWTFADACGNTSSTAQTITVNDNVPPVIAELPAASTIACPATPQFAQATATDNCAGDVTLTFNDVTTNGQCAGSYSVTRTWTATDACGNTATASQTINVEDTVAPVIAALPATSTIECPAAPQFAQATATDACGSAFTLTFNDVTTQGQCAGSYSVTRTWTATDACGNASTATQTINVQDTTAPNITVQAANISIECDGSGNTTALNDWLADNGGAQATDACSDVVWSNNFNGLANDCSAAVTVIFTATDACGNASNTSATFTVQDTTAPVAPQAPANATAVCAADVPANVTLTATDNCSGTITANGVDSIAAGSCPNAFVITRTWTFTDACNNSSSVSQTITVNDNVAPVAPEAPANVTVACAGEVPAMVSLSATDNCGEVITVEGVDAIAAGQCANNYVITRTWTFADACGNTSSTAQTITVNDNVPPVIAELPAASTIACPATPQFAQVTATDNCAGDVTLTFNDVTTNGQCAGSYSVTRTWTATDACGNTATASQTINVEDTVAPVIAQLPEASTIDCPAEPQFAQATATDECGSEFTLTFNDVTTPGQCAGTYSVTRTWTATDTCGNASTATQTINVQDVTPPTINTQAADLVVECDGSGSQDALNNWLSSHGGAAATDTCSNVIWTNNFNTIGNDCSAAVSVIFTATDACGNAASTTATFTIVDTTAPVAPEAPAAVTVSCAGEVPAAANLTATDNCAGDVAGVAVDTVTPGACANAYVITRTWTFTDTCNNQSSVSQTITVNDTVAPVAPEAPANVNVSCASEVPAMVSLTATDNCGEEITTEGVDAIVAGNCPNSFVVTRTWTFTDVCGNSSSISQTINVNDTEAPVAPAAPENVTVTCAGDVPAMVTLTATDNCGDQISASGNDSIAQGNCPNSFVITRTWTFTDACGNASTAQQIITVNDDVAPVAPQAPADITLTCAGEVPAMVSLTAMDNCGEMITVEGVDTTVQGGCPNMFVTTRTWTFTDACGNTSTAQQVITVSDNEAPVVQTKVPVDMTIACTAEVPPMSQLTAEDNCGEVITVDGVDVTTPGDCPNSFVVTRTWTFTDACGNTTTAQQIITVDDNVAPTFNEQAPADITVSCDAVPTAANLTASDNCNGGATVTMSESTNTGACAGSYTLVRTWTATDLCGNVATAVQNITVIDMTSPTFDQAIPANITVECDAIPTAAVLTATDNCGTATVAMTETTTPGACPSSYTLTRTWIATDVCGNPTTGQQVITVIDSTAPFANEAFDAVVNVTCDQIPAVPQLTFGDNCSTVNQPVFVETIINQQAGSYTIVRTWTVDDACGNVGTFTQTVNVTITNADVNIPSRACFTDITPVDLNALLPEGTPTGGTWIDVDGSGGLNGSSFVGNGVQLGTYTLEYPVNDPNCPRTIKVIMTVDEDCGPFPCNDIVIHNAFSPNGDGLNEYFSIENIEQFECYPTNKVEIYNRWGVLVYDTKQYDNAANSFKGISEGRVTVSKASELPTGTYFYIIEYTTSDGANVKKDGYLYLSR